MIRVAIGHRGNLVRGALAAVLSRETDLTVVAELESADDVLVSASGPHVIVLDPLLPGDIGIEELCRRLAGPGVLILLERDEATSSLALALLRQAPRVGLLATDASPDDLVDAVRLVATGKPVLDIELAMAALKAGDNPLTGREAEVLRMVRTGATAPEIARVLCLSAGTVRNYMSRILSKTGARSRIDAIHKAQDAGWI